MECVICKKPANHRNVKGLSVCRDCTTSSRALRDQLNSTRKSKLETAITLREVVQRAMMDRILHESRTADIAEESV